MKISSGVSRRQIVPLSLPTFVTSAPIVVVYLGREPAVAGHVLDHFGEQARVGWLDGSALDTTDPRLKSWIENQHESLGWAPLCVLPSGYFLFVDGKARRYEPGLLDVERDRYSLALGLSASAAAFLLDDGPKAITELSSWYTSRQRCACGRPSIQ